MGLFSRLRSPGRSKEGENAVCSDKGALELIDEGNALENAGQTREALARYDAAIRIAPELARAHLSRGNALLDLGNPVAALEAYAAALVEDPAYASAHYNTGNAYWRSGRHEAAIDAYRNAFAHRPDSPTPRWPPRACSRNWAGTMKRWKATAARSRSTPHAPVHANLGNALRWRTARRGRREYARALEIDPRSST